MNIIFPIIDFLFNYIHKGKERIESDVQNLVKSYKSAEKVIKDKKTSKLNKTLKKQLLDFFNNEDNRQLLLQIFTEDQIDDFLGQSNQKKQDENINKINEKEGDLKYPLINLILTNSKKEKNEKNWKESEEIWNKLEIKIKEKKISKFAKDIKKLLSSYFNDENNKERLIKILSKL